MAIGPWQNKHGASWRRQSARAPWHRHAGQTAQKAIHRMRCEARSGTDTHIDLQLLQLADHHRGHYMRGHMCQWPHADRPTTQARIRLCGPPDMDCSWSSPCSKPTMEQTFRGPGHTCTRATANRVRQTGGAAKPTPANQTHALLSPHRGCNWVAQPCTQLCCFCNNALRAGNIYTETAPPAPPTLRLAA